MSTTEYTLLKVGDVRQAGDEFKKKRNKVWRPIFRSNVGRAVTVGHVKQGFEFRRPVKP